MHKNIGATKNLKGTVTSIICFALKSLSWDWVTALG